MRNFKEYISEATSVMRFLKKNKHLKKKQKEEINRFFTTLKDESRRFESDIGWQSKKVIDMSYEDFYEFMSTNTSGRRRLIKGINIPGRKKEDYWPIKLKSKKHVANIPLNQKTAQFMNSCKYGEINVNYCIGWSDDVEYWDDRIIDDQGVPVYIIDGIKKWVVIIEDGNHSYQVWDKMNDKDISISEKEPIPGFSIKKELLNSSMYKIYDEIRADFFNEDERNEEKEPEYDIEPAQISYDELVSDIEKSKKDYEDSRDDYFDTLADTYKKTLEYYGKKRDIAEEKMDDIASKRDEIDTIIAIDDPDKIENGINMYEYNGKYWDMKQLELLFKVIEEKYSKYEDVWSKLDDLYDEVDNINYNDGYEMANAWDDYEWQGDIPEEYAYEQNVNVPEVSWYSDYMDYLEFSGYYFNDNAIQQDIWTYIIEDSNDSVQLMLANNDLYRPEN